jgi:DNA-binding HxlR family transcriptional regulator
MTNPEREHYQNALGKRYSTTLLLFLLDRKDTMGRDLRQVCTNYTTMVALARELEQLGLIKIEFVNTPYVQHRYNLTSKGRNVAQKLKEIEEIINE